MVYPFVQKWENALPDDPRRTLSVADYCYGFKGEVTVNGVTYTEIDTDGRQGYMEWLETSADFTESKTGKRPEITDQKKDQQRIKFTPAKWDIEEYT